METYTDEAVIQMIKKGGASCDQASEFLYRKFKPIIYSHARSQGAKQEDMVDIFAETISSCILNIIQGKFILDQPLGVYMSVIYKRKTIKYCFRQAKSIKNVVSSLHFSEESDIQRSIDIKHLEDPYDALLQTELRAKMQEAINHMQEKCRLLFELTFINTPMLEIGNTFIEKGFIQANSDAENAAKSQHKRCKSDLKQLISKRYPELIEYYLK
jgi:RNA polymerase sigma factor (sigma-70 family)